MGKLSNRIKERLLWLGAVIAALAGGVLYALLHRRESDTGFQSEKINQYSKEAYDASVKERERIRDTPADQLVDDEPTIRPVIDDGRNRFTSRVKEYLHQKGGGGDADGGR